MFFFMFFDLKEAATNPGATTPVSDRKKHKKKPILGDYFSTIH